VAPLLFAQTPPTASPTPDPNLKNLSPGEEIQILQAIDSQNKATGTTTLDLSIPVTTSNGSPSTVISSQAASSITTPTPAAVVSGPAGPPPPPAGLTSLVLKEGVYLTWNAIAGAGASATYNVYRSTTPGWGYRQINLKSLPAPYFLDGVPSSISPPKNGEDYFYVVAGTDAQGRLSDYSDEIAVNPKDMEIPETEAEKAAEAKNAPVSGAGKDTEEELKVPEQKIVNLQLPADTQLSIQGYKKIEADFSFQKFNRPDQNGVSPEVDSTLVNQEMVVNLEGKVGKNVDVHVDYSDVNRAGGVDQSKQEISIVYHGDTNSPVQEVAFGDLQMNLPNTEFAGFSKQLFGLQAKLKFDNFRVTSFFAQTKGIAETRVFNGNTGQVTKDFNDIDYIRERYYLMTKAVSLVAVGGVAQNQALPAANSEQIWVNSETGGSVSEIGPNFIWPYEHWLPGRDYTIDYNTGIITFIRAMSTSAQIVVGFTTKTGSTVGLNTVGTSVLSNSTLIANFQVPSNGVIDNSNYLIKNSNNQTSTLYLVNYFDLGRDKIIPPQQDPNFVFQVIDQGTNNVLQTGQGGLGNAAAPWAYVMNQDFNYLVVNNANNANVTISPQGSPVTTANFSERAFVNPVTDPTLGTGTNGIYYELTSPNSLKRIHMVYKTQLNFFQLNRFNIIRGSDTVFLDGRRLRRDVDYTLDYTSGFLDFPDKSILRPDSQLVISYEYAPFGSFSQNNILGTRLEYDVTDHLFIGSTFLNSTSQQPQDMPQIGSTPNSLTVLDADFKYDLGQEDVQGITGMIPGLADWKPPVSVKLSGEIAESYFNPDTYNMEGETGVAMVDNMEGIDNVNGPTMNATNWIVSSNPQPVNSLGNVVYDNSSDNTKNNRVRFRNGPIVCETAPTTATIPGAGGHIYAGVLNNSGTGNATDAISVLQVPYSNLTNHTWAGLRQTLSATGLDLTNTRYMQAWIYNDGQPKWIMMDFGIMNEAINANTNGIEQEVLPLNASDDIGLLTNYFNPNGTSVLQIGGTGTAITDEPQGTQEGAGNNILDTEDAYGEGSLNYTDGYYEYGVQANWTGWQIVKIPVDFDSSAVGNHQTDQNVNYFFQIQGNASPALIRTIRFWMTGASSTPVNGTVLFESIQFNRDLWQLQVDPTANVNQGVTVNTGKFDVNSISQDQDGGYQPTTRFIVIPSGTSTSSILAKEKALKITYNVSSADFEPSGNISGKPIYYASRFFNQGVDFTDYTNLAFDLFVRTASVEPGEILFVRIGNDQLNYYQYNIPLSSRYQGSWNTITTHIDGSDGNRQTVGTPFINRATQVSFGVLSPNPPNGLTKELWINNLRTNTPNQRSGLARRANAAFVFGDNFATVNTRYREVDSGFSQIDQTSTHFQHSTQYGVDYNSNAVSVFGSSLATQFSYTDQNLYTEAALLQNPYFSALPDTHSQNTTGSITYTKDLGAAWGRLTNVRLSESTYAEDDVYQSAVTNQPGIQGNNQKGNQTYTLGSTYDAPSLILGLPIGANQFTETYILTYDTQNFDSGSLSNYQRTTKNQTYGWTNTTELFKNLIFTPGYNLNLVDAVGNTNSPGTAGAVSQYTNFQERDQPKGGLTYRGIPGVIPAVNYTGSEQIDNVSYPEGPRLNTSNSLNYSVNLSPSQWWDPFQKIGLTAFGGRTQSASEAIPDFRVIKQPLSFNDLWGLDPRNDVALNSTKSLTDQINFSFRLFDFWDFKPTGSWTNQFNLLSAGTNPVEQDSDTYGFTTVFNHKLLTVPLINFGFDSAQFQYTRTDSTQWDSSQPPPAPPSGQTVNETFAFTVPYDIANQSQGNFHYQHTDGLTNTSGIVTNQLDDQYSVEYNQKFLENTVLHIPFTHWKIKFDQAIELKLAFLAELVNNDCPDFTTNDLKTERYRGTLTLNYNALKNLRIGLGVVNEYFVEDIPYPYLGYTLWQINISGEARF